MNMKEYRPSFAQLRTFVTVAEHKHFGTAAQKLQISQPSLSQALVALETGLEMQLIERSTRRVIVTPAGEALLPHAKAVLDAIDAFHAHARGTIGALQDTLTLGIIPTIAPYILPTLLHSIQHQYPKLELTIIEDQTQHLLNRLKEGTIDCALMALPSHATGVEEISLYTEDFKVVTERHHPLAQRNDLRLEDLGKLNLLLLDDGHCLRDQVIDLCRKASVVPLESMNAETRAASLTTVMQLVAAGMGSTLIPESALATEVNRAELAVSSFDERVSASRTVGLVHRSSTGRVEDFHLLGALLTNCFQAVIAK